MYFRKFISMNFKIIKRARKQETASLKKPMLILSNETFFLVQERPSLCINDVIAAVPFIPRRPFLA